MREMLKWSLLFNSPALANCGRAHAPTPLPGDAAARARCVRRREPPRALLRSAIERGLREGSRRAQLAADRGSRGTADRGHRRSSSPTRRRATWRRWTCWGTKCCSWSPTPSWSRASGPPRLPRDRRPARPPRGSPARLMTLAARRSKGAGGDRQRGRPRLRGRDAADRGSAPAPAHQDRGRGDRGGLGTSSTARRSPVSGPPAAGPLRVHLLRVLPPTSAPRRRRGRSCGPGSPRPPQAPLRRRHPLERPARGIRQRGICRQRDLPTGHPLSTGRMRPATGRPRRMGRPRPTRTNGAWRSAARRSA